MANSYWYRTYGSFMKVDSGAQALHGKEKEEFVRDWRKMQKLFEPFMPNDSDGSKKGLNI